MVIYYIVSLYMLHIFLAKDKGEKIHISTVLPDFFIKELQFLESFSKEKEFIKSLKSQYFRLMLTFLIVAIVYLALILV